MIISLVAALTRDRVIGYQGRMPWHLPAELAYFKKMTLGKPVLMGRRTFEAIGKPLPGRRNLILTRQTDLLIPGCEIYPTLESALAAVAGEPELMVIGGSILFEQTLPIADRLYLTFVDCETPGDAFFPAWNPNDWRETQRTSHPADSANRFSFLCVQWDRLA
jgi:dihydrofolate reductase